MSSLPPRPRPSTSEPAFRAPRSGGGWGGLGTLADIIIVLAAVYGVVGGIVALVFGARVGPDALVIGLLSVFVTVVLLLAFGKLIRLALDIHRRLPDDGRG